MAFDELKARQAAAYSSAPFELLAESSDDIYERLLDALGVVPGESWLDLATGTGALATRAARRGAIVTGQDLAEGLIDTARRHASEQGVAATFDVGDCEDLPYPDASFDVVSSTQGAVFAPDHGAVAAQLARVCRSGGRIGLTAWRPGGAIERFFSIMARYRPSPPAGAGDPLNWGRPEHVRDLLGDAFTLEFAEAESPQLAWSPAALWRLFTEAFGPVKALAEALPPDRREQFHQDFIAFYEEYRVPGGVSSPREYLVIVGHRK